MSLEVWREIPGTRGGYSASSLGRVRSNDRITTSGRKWRGKILTPSTRRDGYLSVSTWTDGKQKTYLVHRAVLLAFRGPCPAGHEGLHRDGDRSNNALSNLAWGTHSENQHDQVRHGMHVNAAKEKCPSGHPYTDENTYWYPGKPHRGCRACRRVHAANHQAKTRSRSNA